MTGRIDTFVNTVQAAMNIKAETLGILQTTRTLLAAVDLSPGHRTISGGMSFENVFMLNGVQISDNVRNTPFTLFIEDALDQVTTTTSGVSAE